jgi:aspartate 1-decarboxylase
MQHLMLKCKLHRVRVTHAELQYEGSCAIDGALLEAAGIREYEQIQIYNINNGERFTTYAIRAESGTGVISVNGAAARRVCAGDLLIICAYVGVAQAALDDFKPTLIYVDEQNAIVRRSDTIPLQMAG